MTAVIDIAKKTTSVLKAGTLIVTDGIIDLSLMREGTRPKPGRHRGWPKGLRERLWQSQGSRCIYCGVRVRLAHYQSQIDHVVPVVRGGSNEENNLQLTCPQCNGKKGDRTDAEFRYRLRSLLSGVRGHIPNRVISQQEIRRVMAEFPDADTYIRFKEGKYLTAAQKVNAGSVATGAVVSSSVFFPIFFATTPEDASVLLVCSIATGLASAAWVRFRAKLTSKDQE